MDTDKKNRIPTWSANTPCTIARPSVVRVLDRHDKWWIWIAVDKIVQVVRRSPDEWYVYTTGRGTSLCTEVSGEDGAKVLRALGVDDVEELEAQDRG